MTYLLLRWTGHHYTKVYDLILPDGKKLTVKRVLRLSTGVGDTYEIIICGTLHVSPGTASWSQRSDRHSGSFGTATRTSGPRQVRCRRRSCLRRHVPELTMHSIRHHVTHHLHPQFSGLACAFSLRFLVFAMT